MGPLPLSTMYLHHNYDTEFTFSPAVEKVWCMQYCIYIDSLCTSRKFPLHNCRFILLTIVYLISFQGIYVYPMAATDLECPCAHFDSVVLS